jgi:hypothetical protein
MLIYLIKARKLGQSKIQVMVDTRTSMIITPKHSPKRFGVTNVISVNEDRYMVYNVSLVVVMIYGNIRKQYHV